MPERPTNVPMADAAKIDWRPHPRVAHVDTKPLLSAADNPRADVYLVRVPVGAEIGRHIHETQVETLFVLTGQGAFLHGEAQTPCGPGFAAAVPIGHLHGMVNTGHEPLELITFFTPPVA